MIELLAVEDLGDGAGIGALLGYLGSVAAAGGIGLWLAEAYERRAAVSDRLPSSTGFLRGLAAVLIVCAVTVVVNGVAARTTTVTDVGPAVNDRSSALNVTVTGPGGVAGYRH